MKLWTTSLIAAVGLTLHGGAMLTAQSGAYALKKIDVQKLSGGKSICVGTAAQVVGPNAIVALVGTNPECYRDLPQVELISFSMDGQIIARKQWSSTFQFAVVSGERIVVNSADELVVFNLRFESVQSIPLASIAHISIQFSVASPITMAAYPGYARPPRVFELAGEPLQMSEIVSASDRVAKLSDGDAVSWDGGELRRTRDGSTVSTYDLSWLKRCNKLCQSWTGVQLESIVSGPSASVALLMAKGSKVPLTDSGGLFPFTRIQAIDLNTGQALFQQDFSTDQENRSAALDQTGALLALSDKHQLTIYQIKLKSTH